MIGPLLCCMFRYVATGGDDGLLKFWDLRKPDAAVAVLSGHTHWCKPRACLWPPVSLALTAAVVQGLGCCVQPVP